MKFHALAAACFSIVTMLAAAADAADGVNRWPQDLSKTPCSAWTRGSDGTWLQIGAIQVGSRTVVNSSFARNSPQATLLQAKCGAH